MTLSDAVVEVGSAMLPHVYHALLRDFRPDLSIKYWERLFSWPWQNPEGHVGYALMDERDQMVGYLGLIYSHQSVAGGIRLLCNMSTWVVREEHRGASLALLMGVLGRRDVTITSLTASDRVCRVLTRLGFHVLESHVRVFLPLLSWIGVGKERRALISVGAETIYPRLSAPLSQILVDHAQMGEHVLAEGPKGSCYVILSRGRRWMVPTGKVLYVSEPTAFVRLLPAIHRQLLLRRGMILLECDERLVSGVAVPPSRRVTLTVPRLYRPAGVNPREISNLYSELALLEL